MLETEIKKLTAAVEANTAAITGNKVAAAISEKVAPTAEETKEAVQASPAAATPTDAFVEGIDPLDDLAITPDDAKPAETAAAQIDVAAATKDDVIAATIALAKAKTRDAPVVVFATFGIKKATECPEAKYGELLAALVAAL